MVDEENEWCEDDPLLRPAIYSLETNYQKDNSNSYLTIRWEGGLSYSSDYLLTDKKVFNRFKNDENDKDAKKNLVFKVYFVNNEWISRNLRETLGKPEYNKQLGDFSRMIRVQGVYNKDDNSKIYCWATKDKECQDSSAKEVRFCSTVIYSSPYQGIVNVCAIMTNYIE